MKWIRNLVFASVCFIALGAGGVLVLNHIAADQIMYQVAEDLYHANVALKEQREKSCQF